MRRLATVICLAIACAITTNATAQPSWSTPDGLSTPGQAASAAIIALSSDGTMATAVWREQDANRREQLMTSSATISGGVASWGPVTKLSATDSGVTEAVVRVSSDGTKATALWIDSDSKQGSSRPRASSAVITGNTASWGPITSLLSAGIPVVNVGLALSLDGTRATAVWNQYPPITNRGVCKSVDAISATISGNAASWGSPKQLSEQGRCTDGVAIGMSSAGTSATVVWASSVGSDLIIRAKSGTISGTTSAWGSVTDLSAVGFKSQLPQVAVSSDGTRATAVWARTIPASSGSPAGSLIRSRSATIGGKAATWGATSVLSTVGAVSSSPLLALSDDGSTAIATWLRSIGTARTVQSASATVAGDTATWGAITDVSATGRDIRSHALALTPDGSKATTVWTRTNGSKFVLQGSTGEVQGTSQAWGSVFDISDPTYNSVRANVEISVDGALACTGWNQDNGHGRYIARTSVGTLVQPTPTPTATPVVTGTPVATSTPTATPTPTATNTPTSTPTPAPTVTPVGTVSTQAPVSNHSSNDGRVVLRLRDRPNNFSRNYYGYLLQASDYKLIAWGKFKVTRGRGTLVLHVTPGEYITFTAVFRSKKPNIISSRHRRITVK